MHVPIESKQYLLYTGKIDMPRGGQLHIMLIIRSFQVVI